MEFEYGEHCTRCKKHVGWVSESVNGTQHTSHTIICMDCLPVALDEAIEAGRLLETDDEEHVRKLLAEAAS